MTHIDHHSKPYDEGTLNKLDIFSRYIETWLPTFIMQDKITEINIVDFFAGLGYDSEGKPGSPIRTLENINSFFGNLMKHNTIINLYLNEFNNEKFERLKVNCEVYLEKNSRIKQFIKIHYFSKDFNDVYNEINKHTRNKPSLYVIDQSGIRFTSQENFNTLLTFERTDFLFFISSSFFKRFNKEDEFNRYLDISEEDLKTNPYNFIHRIVLNKYRSLIPNTSKLKIFPFSIKKNTNIYGIIFGSKHIRGVEKFLKIAWDKNKLNGEADYDIDDDLSKDQMILNFDNPGESKKPTKIESFQNKIEKYIKETGIVTNRDLYHFTYNEGHIAIHTNEKLRELKSKGIVNFSGHSKITWDAVNNNNLVTFKWRG